VIRKVSGDPIVTTQSYFRRLALGLIILVLGQAVALAETIVVRNDTNVPLIIQAGCVVNGSLRRDKPVLVGPGGKLPVALPGNKVITVYDARVGNRVLNQSNVPASKDDGIYTLQPDAAGRIQLAPVPQVGGTGK
jgi:hypothetical protein